MWSFPTLERFKMLLPKRMVGRMKGVCMAGLNGFESARTWLSVPSTE